MLPQLCSDARRDRLYGGLYFSWNVPPFGLSPVAAAVQSVALATDMYLRDHFAMAISTYIDDSGCSDPSTKDHPDAVARVNSKSAIVLIVKTELGFYISPKMSPFAAPVRPFLGFELDCQARCFRIPAKKQTRYLSFLDEVCSANEVSYKILERLVGRLLSLWVIVPFTKLWVDHLLRALKLAQSCRSVMIPFTSAMRAELSDWRVILQKNRDRFWHGPGSLSVDLQNISPNDTLDIFTDATVALGAGRVRGGRFSFPGGTDTFRTVIPSGSDGAADIFAAEAYALRAVLDFVIPLRPRTFIHTLVDNMPLYSAWHNERAPGVSSTSAWVTDQLKQIARLLIQHSCTLHVSWVRSQDNDADEPTRIEAPWHRARLITSILDLVRGLARRAWNVSARDDPFEIDLCADDANICQKFYSRFFTPGCVGVDALSQPRLGWIDGQPLRSYCYPPHAAVLPFFESAQRTGIPWALVTIGSPADPWWHRVRAASREHHLIARRGTMACLIPSTSSVGVWRPSAIKTNLWLFLFC